MELPSVAAQMILKLKTLANVYVCMYVCNTEGIHVHHLPPGSLCVL